MGHSTLKSNWAGAEEMRRFIFIGSEGKKAPARGGRRAPKGFCILDMQGLAFLCMGNLSQITSSLQKYLELSYDCDNILS